MDTYFCEFVLLVDSKICRQRIQSITVYWYRNKLNLWIELDLSMAIIKIIVVLITVHM